MVSRQWRPPQLDGHIWHYGRTGSGKSWKNVAIAQYYFAHGFKIWDLYGGKRREGPFWCFTSDELRLWFEYQKEVGDMKEAGPKEYKVNLYFPMIYGKLPNKLPGKKPRITSKVFTIFFKDIKIEDIAVVTGALSGNAKRTWGRLVKELSDESNGEDILDWFNKEKNKAMKNTALYELFILPAIEFKLLTAKSNKLNLNDEALIEEAEDKNTIFVLADDFVPKEFELFFMKYIARKIVWDLVNEDKIHKKNLSVWREMNLFMKVQDESAQDAEQKGIMRAFFSELARYGRSGFFILGDTQSPYEVRGLISGQDDLLCISELPGSRDRDEALERYRKDGRIGTQQISYIGIMPIEQMVVIERRKKALLIKRVQPPRTRGWKRIDGTFFSVWKKVYNEWNDNVNEEFKVYVNHRYKLNKAMLHEKRQMEISDEKPQKKKEMPEQISKKEKVIEEVKDEITDEETRKLSKQVTTGVLQNL